MSAASNKREPARRDAPKTRVAAPGLVHFSRFVWCGVVIALLGFGAAFILSGLEKSDGAIHLPSIILGGVIAGFGVLCAVFVALLMARKRVGREMLTTFAFVAAIPMFIRGIPGLSVVAAAMILAAAALWTPKARAYFRKDTR